MPGAEAGGDAVADAEEQHFSGGPNVFKGLQWNRRTRGAGTYWKVEMEFDVGGGRND